MAAAIDEILTNKPDTRLRLYAWSPIDPPADYIGLIKVGQTTQADVNVRIRQSQGQMQQTYTLHTDLNIFAEREDGSTFRDGDVRQRLIDKGFETQSLAHRANGYAARPKMFAVQFWSYSMA